MKEADQRDMGSVVAGLWAYQKGAHYLRVHNVIETKRALKLYVELEGQK